MAAPSRAESTDKNNSAKTVFDVIRDHGGSAIQPQITADADARGVSRNTCNKWLNRLVEEGKLSRNRASRTDMVEARSSGLVSKGAKTVNVFTIKKTIAG